MLAINSEKVKLTDLKFGTQNVRLLLFYYRLQSHTNAFKLLL